MDCGSYGVAQVLVGLHRVGVVGLRRACESAKDAGLTDREETVDYLLDELTGDNFIPPARIGDYRLTLWREYLRYRGEDFSEFFSTIQVEIRGGSGEDQLRFADLCFDVFADFELRPVIEIAGVDDGETQPRLVIDGETIVQGLPSRAALKTAIDHRLSDF